MNIPNETQERRVLRALQEAEGWVNKQYLVRNLGFTQEGRAIHNLENDPRWFLQNYYQ